jgi:hypothetical protein
LSGAEAARALKENARALRLISVRRTVGAEDENDIRYVASNLEAIALELTTAKGEGR